MPDRHEPFANPQVLRPPPRRGVRLLRSKGAWFDDDNLDLISHVLDDWLRIPGTHIRVGLDGIVGLISVLVGAIPIAGDIFDIGWKANRRNYKLLTRHMAHPHQHTWKDWAFLMLLGGMLVAVFVTPVVVLLFVLRWIAGR
jgi:hypothetical protein